MSERDDIVTRLRTDDASDDLLISAASLLETDADEIERLRAEVALWHQVWDNVALDVPDLRDDNKPLAVAASYELLKREVARLTAEQDAVSVAIGTNEFMDPPDGGNVSLAEQVRRMRDALLACVEATEKRIAELEDGVSVVADFLPGYGDVAEIAASRLRKLLRIDAAMEGGK